MKTDRSPHVDVSAAGSRSRYGVWPGSWPARRPGLWPALRPRIARRRLHLGLTLGVVALAWSLVLGASPNVVQAGGVAYTSLRGTDRYDTAIKISKEMFSAALPAGGGLVLAPGETFPEALCGAPLAAAYGGPVLLTPGVGLNNAVKAEMVRLAPSYVICIGLSQVVIDQVQKAVGATATVGSISYADGDVYDMSCEVARALAAKMGGLGGATAIITRGDVFPDAIGVSSLACYNKWPILLTTGPAGDLPVGTADVLDELGIVKAIKVGTYASLPASITGLANLSGSDRYQTNRNVARWAESNAGMTFAHVGLATGDKFPDALAAGPYLAADAGIILLSPLSKLSATISPDIAAHADTVGHVSFIAMIRPVTSQVKALLSDLVFDETQAMTHVYELAVNIGPRRGGTDAEFRAAQYAASYLEGLGYAASITDVPVPNGLTSHNVVAVKPGVSPLTIVVGGHMDSKVSSSVASPGGNDNASGSGTVLELARALKDTELVPTVVFVLFGNEEGIGGTAYDHHFGSRRFVATMTDEERANLAGMISLDMVGCGSVFNLRMMERGPRLLRDLLQGYAAAMNIPLVYLRDNSTDGYSDHEPFEVAGYPAAWLEWRTDPNYHTARDTYENCNAAKVQTAGALTLGFLADLEVGDLLDLRRAME